jgi:hypothetical protein
MNNLTRQEVEILLELLSREIHCTTFEKICETYRDICKSIYYKVREAEKKEDSDKYCCECKYYCYDKTISDYPKCRYHWINPYTNLVTGEKEEELYDCEEARLYGHLCGKEARWYEEKERK